MKAVQRLEKLLTAKSEAVSLGAARSVLELGQRLRDTVELEERIAELERRADGVREQAEASGSSVSASRGPG
jgi:predicted NAD/FAD-binding protein